MTTTPQPPPQPDETPEGAAGAATAGRDPLEIAADLVDDVSRELDPAELASLERLDQPRRILFVHAHPDDESIGTGATMARYAEAGAGVVLLTATRGELGEVIPPELAHLDPDALAEHRTGELATAMEALGVSDHRFLTRPDGTGYRDSGMVWLEPGRAAAGDDVDPRSLAAADPEEVAARIAEVVREVRPQVVVTYEPGGGYGHPDHVRVHEATVRALVLAAGDGSRGAGGAVPWQVAKVYEIVQPERPVREALRRLAETGAEGAGDPEGPLPSVVVPDGEVTTVVDGTGQVPAKIAALRAHATQVTLDLDAAVPAMRLSNGVPQPVWPQEHYRLVHGVAGGPYDAEGRETDLFAGIAPSS
ncbi:N-acetyl-1-D-myo-inositol-2-amino-2-deoxy-alpha-D-glucopyranoside deacetylase [Kineococcus radiotolerans]|uniref:1D-myo-inositol 2-acetamido-2-deoxy-alpha-D-glucopyranoside deacetylase n=1 Tax=Kineococcus radiotolerans (strain ATCC BAA-149 / DSM 14245 / SRS30216) TaxID=266940 RepID=MSHB_KINRD|nr:N-acetyl-1-D-myo-inositol-2-amino-2-deoxy-alpha-D-glucopyranoside deacetylase [Kineococcus radiotolerans]A6W733.1 RecName: Full=1D-myo-inositol 2-acetamido-2-deoxy-alpha-D-glucopyranoside deacetylase; Short=GlcNAc-Ins deacetylase; AltName: Full=N-acetyl-1-D-myo-inositol 2-amino-2-deoxy-alpha-D-glucopyranoside deacetylase [Kineococcus radiotolerans SRS30216 = ATCC BAA-149]ABS02622.1 LmbE family protein [Kineococcus radiotolerans SRS30216 = ATCC BAA-149]